MRKQRRWQSLNLQFHKKKQYKYHEIKRNKFQEITDTGKAVGWYIRIWAVEVGCRGFQATSMATLLKYLWYSGTQRKPCLHRIGKAAETASHATGR